MAASELTARKRRTILFVLLGLAFVLVWVAVIAFTSWRRSLSPVRGEPLSSVFVSPYRNTVPGIKYVGDTACGECHQSHAESYHRHPMGRSLAPVSQSLRLEQFDRA